MGHQYGNSTYYWSNIPVEVRASSDSFNRAALKEMAYGTEHTLPRDQFTFQRINGQSELVQLYAHCLQKTGLIPTPKVNWVMIIMTIDSFQK